MKLIDFLKNKRKKLVEASVNEKSTIKKADLSKIKIVIENHHEVVENEVEKIKEAGEEFYEKGQFDNIEEAIVFFATMFDGLSYKGIEKDENGNTIIKFRDVDLRKNYASIK